MPVDPLPSWNDGSAKSAIVDFVSAVTRQADPTFVPPAERIAVFDNDGTLWCEQPMQTQIFFAADRLKELVARDPALGQRQPFKAFLEHDTKTLAGLGKQGLFEIAFATHAGVTTDVFEQVVREWFATARHPKLGRPIAACVYQPQLELLHYLRSNGFVTFIVSGGGVDFMRPFAEAVYGIPPHQVIGSSVKTRIEMQGDDAAMVKLAELGSFDDREVKPQNIALHIGRRPILAFGNSDGDLAMMRYVKAGRGRRLALLLHHDDAEREFAYDRGFRLSPLAEALDKAGSYGIQVVSMRRDWKNVFAEAGDYQASRHASSVG
jgi:phosphoglycolate phosphatase-like HAD superfamily hydrolase